MMDNYPGLTELLDAWPAGQDGLQRAFRELIGAAESHPGSSGALTARPGVSYSFRALIDYMKSRIRPVYFLVDVVISPVDPWFLSVCFYEDEITDPDGLGNPIPFGLFNETGYCFDLEDYHSDFIAYLGERITEAYQSAIS